MAKKKKSKQPSGGNCYEVAFEMVVFGDFSGWLICHGIATLEAGPLKGEKYGHAWIESPDGEMVIDGTVGAVIPKSAYYKRGKISYVVRYTQSEARDMALLHETYGAWDKKIQSTLHS